MGERPRVSIVVPVFNRAAELESCLRSLRAQTYPAERLELIVVDNGSTDGSGDVARRVCEAPDGGVSGRVVVEPRRGPAAARNRGLREATGELIAFTDSDCVAAPDWIEQLVAPFGEAAAQAPSPHLLAPDPLLPLGFCGGAVEAHDPRTPLERYIAERPVASQEAFARRTRFSFPFFMTANVVFLKRAVEEVGGFDAGLSPIPAGEDADLCWRVAWAGYGWRYVPGAVVSHRHRSTLGGFSRQVFRYGVGSVDLFRKHRARFDCRSFVDWPRHWVAVKLIYRVAIKRWFLSERERAWAFYDLVGLWSFAAGRLWGSLRNRVLFL